MLLVPVAPVDSACVDVTGEFHAIEHELSLMPHPCKIAVRVLLAPTIDDFHRALLTYQPHIIHISGHASNDSLWFRDVDRPSRAISATFLSRLLAAHVSDVRLVVMNTCNSDAIARELTKYVASAIGFAASVDDATARTFAVTIYRTLALGWSIEHAFQQAVAAIQPGDPERGPRLYCHDGVNPADVSCGGSAGLQLCPTRRLHRKVQTRELRVSPALVEVCQVLHRHEIVVVVGAGIRAATELSPWPSLVHQLAEHARAYGISNGTLGGISTLVEQHRIVDALSELEQALGSVEFGYAVERLLDDGADELPEAAVALASLAPHLRAVLTTNLDRVIERAFAGAWPVVPRAAGDSAQRERVIVKLHGTLGQRDTWILTREQYSRAACGEGSLRDALRGLFRSRTLLFVGYQPTDPDFVQLLDLLDVTREHQPPRHYALIARDGLTRYHRKRMDRAGIRVILYDDTRGALTQLLRTMAHPYNDTPLPELPVSVDCYG